MLQSHAVTVRRLAVCGILLVTALLVSSSDSSAQTGLVASYGFNEGSGTTTADASGNGNTGTLSNTTWSTAGKFGSALTFNGTSSWVTVADAASLRLSSAMTVEAWVYATAASVWRVVALKEASTGLAFALYASDTGSYPSGWIHRTNDVGTTGPSALTLNTWVHLATTYDGSAVRLYVNGAQVSSTAVTGTIGSSTSPFRIGGDSYWGEYFTGRIDEVRVYNRALAATEIQTDMATAIGGGIPPAPDFSIALSPASRSIVQGTSTTYTVTAAAVNGFTGTVTLSASGLPSNATASFSPAMITGAGTATMTVTTAGTTPTGAATITATGTSGTLTHAATASLTVTASPVPDFSIALSPSSQSVVQGNATSYTVTIGAVNGFTGTVNLAASGLPSNATASFSPASITTAGTATMTVTTAGTTPTGSSTLTATGTSGTLTHAATASLAVTLAASAPAGTISIDFVGTGTAMGASEVAGVLPAGNWNNASGASRTTALALVDVNGGATPATATWTANGTNRTTTTDTAGGMRMMRGYLDTSSTSTTTVTIAGLPQAQYDVYAYADGNNGTSTRTGAYTISGSGITTTTVNLTDSANTNFTGTYVRATNSAGNYVKFSFSGTGFTLKAVPGTASTSTRRAPLNGIQIVPSAPPAPDFSIAATPSSASVVQGTGGSYTVNIGALNGFTGTIGLSVAGLPANATARFTPASVTGNGTATLSIATTASTPTGTSTLTITGTSGALTRSVNVTLTVTPLTYSISGSLTPVAYGASATVALGGNAVASTTADSSGNFAFNGLPNGTYQVTPSKTGYTFSPTSQTIGVNGAAVTGVTFTVAPSANTVTISSPANGANVSSTFTVSATASAAIAGVQFRIDGAAVGAEDTASPFSVSVTAPAGSHTLTAVGRDALNNTVVSAPVTVTVGSFTGTSLTINGLQTFQTLDGIGVNINSLSWKNGQLKPALDALAGDLGVTVWRVVFDMTDWESTNDNSDPNTPDWTYYNALYSNAKFQNLWGTLHYLNQKGITSNIALSFMGQVPTWMGGSKIASGMEAEWVEMVSTLVQYARNTEGVQFDILDPINEPDWDGYEGPQVASNQYVTVLSQLSNKLDALGLGSIHFVGPNPAQINVGVSDYIPTMMANASLMSKVDHFGLHNYTGDAGGAATAIRNSAYPSKNFWMTELSIPEQIFTLIGQGASAAIIWEAYDSVYNHAILAGRGSTAPNDAGNLAALLAYNSSNGTYSKRSQFYQEQAFKYVPAGSVRIGATISNGSLAIYAFKHPVSGVVTIIGRNSGGSSTAISGSMSSVGAVGAFKEYQSTINDNYNSFTRGNDVVVSNGSFVFTAPAYSFFTLTTAPQ